MEHPTALTPEGNIYLLAEDLQGIGARLEMQFEQTGSMDDLNLLIRISSTAVELLPRGHPDLLNWLNNLGHWLGRRSEWTGFIVDFNQAVEITEAAVEATAQDDANRPTVLTNLGNRLGRRFERTGSIDDLNRAIEATRMAIEATPNHHAHRAGRLNNLGVWLGRRFEKTGSMDDLNWAINAAGDAIDATPEDHPNRVNWLNTLGNKLGTRFKATGSIDDLSRAIDAMNTAMKATPQDHPNRAIIFNSLGNHLGMRFKRTGTRDDLNRAIEVTSIAAEAVPHGHPDRPGMLSSFGNKLGLRFERTDSIGDLNRAIEAISLAVAATPQDHPDRADWLTCLGSWLGSRHDRTGSMDDLNRAIDNANLAIETTSRDDPSRAGRLNNLGSLLTTRFNRNGSIDDLNRAIEVTAPAVEGILDNHPDRVTLMSTLGVSLGTRHSQTGSVDDLNRAIELLDIVVDTIPKDLPDRVNHLSNLGTVLKKRHERTGSMKDLNRAIEMISIAAETIPPGHPRQAIILDNLGGTFGRRFERTRSIDDLNQAIEKTNMAVEATPPGHPDRPSWCNNLGTWLGVRFRQTGSMNDLNRAIDLTRMAVDDTPRDQPNRATWLTNLGDWLRERYEQTNSVDDLAGALSSYQGGWNCYTAPPSTRINLAQSAARILASKLDWEHAGLLLEEAVHLLPNVSPRSLRHTDKQHMLAKCAGLAPMAAAMALQAGKTADHALQLLELGRGVISGLLMEIRADISDLKREHFALAAEFISLRDELDAPLETATFLTSHSGAQFWESQVKRRREVEKNFNNLIIRIRDQPGFRNFLLPPTADELMAAADPDPIIVVNVSSLRCDAFLIEHNRIRALELPGLTIGEIAKQARSLRLSRLDGSFQITPMLEWLWDAIGRPTLESLGFVSPISDDNWPRVWWIPTGPLNHLPLHAAGQHADGSTETVLDRVMSSYTSSIKALIYGRGHRVRNSEGPASSDHALLVAMPETPDLPPDRRLKFAGEEVKMLEDLCKSLQLKPIQPGRWKEDVLRHLRSCKIFHFAGHGQTDPADPSQSYLLLNDWKDNPLTVGDLRDCRLQESQPFLGYLSACSTGANEAHRLADEGIHLISAFQLAGFRHVVGTLWEVSDKHCVSLARVLYETMRDEGMTDMAVCRGLHRGVRALRDGLVEKESGTRNATLLGFGSQKKGLDRLTSTFWVPYIHFSV
jgi:tetratricopeptide (TPR) repeat protein